MALILNSNAIIDLDPFKRYIGVPIATTTEDEEIRDVINESSALIESYCNRKFREATITEVVNGGNSYEIMLAQWPITAVTSVHVDSARLFPASTLIDAATYTTGQNEKGEGYTIELYDNRFPKGRKNIQVIYTYGYVDFAAVPADLQLACKRVGGYYWKLQQSQSFIEVQKTKGNENLTIIDGIPIGASLILDNYTRLEMLAPPDSVRNT